MKAQKNRQTGRIWLAKKVKIPFRWNKRRILFLKGEVEMKPAAEVQKIHEPEKMLELARQMEEQSARHYNLWANECSANADSVSKTLFESLVGDEERHFDLYDTELENLKLYGPQYLALQSIERIKGGGTAPQG